MRLSRVQKAVIGHDWQAPLDVDDRDRDAKREQRHDDVIRQVEVLVRQVEPSALRGQVPPVILTRFTHVYGVPGQTSHAA